jgi:hypothetical protein
MLNVIMNEQQTWKRALEISGKLGHDKRICTLVAYSATREFLPTTITDKVICEQEVVFGNVTDATGNRFIIIA